MIGLAGWRKVAYSSGWKGPFAWAGNIFDMAETGCITQETEY